MKLCGFDEAFLTPWTSDGDFTLATGNTDGLAALGAIEIPVLPVTDLVKEPEELPIFLITGIGIPGKNPIQRPEHQSIGKQGHHQMEQGGPQQGSYQRNHQGTAQQSQTQLVGTVTAGHEPLKPLRDFFHEA